MTTAQTVKTSFVETGGVRYAYRRLGPATGIPVIFLHHFRATMDHWDPLLVNLIAEKYPIILFDNAGVGHSSGQIPSSIPEMAQHLITFLKALKIDAVVLFGFSLGGMVALQAALDSEHSLVRKLIISGSGPGRGPNGGQELIDPDPKITNENALGNIQLENMLNLFFYDSDSSRAIGQVWYNRVFERNESTSGEKRADWVQAEGIVAQGTAMAKWSTGGGKFTGLSHFTLSMIRD